MEDLFSYSARGFSLDLFLNIIFILGMSLMTWSLSMLRIVRKKNYELETKFSSLVQIIDSGNHSWAIWNLQANSVNLSPNLKDEWELDQYENIPVHEFIQLFDESAHAALEDGLYQLRYNLMPLDLILQLVRNEKVFRVLAKGGGGETVAIWLQDVTHDMNERHQNNLKINSLLEERQRLRSILDAIPYPIWYRSQSGGLLFNNSAYNYVAEGISGKLDEKEHTLWLQMGLPQNSELSFLNLEQSSRRHCVIEGQRRLLEFHEETLNQDKIGYAIDLTQVESAEKDLRRHIEAHKEVLETLTIGITIYNAERRLVFFNHAYARMYEFDESFLNAQPSIGEVLENLRSRNLIQEASNFPEFKKKIYNQFTSLISSYQELAHLTDGRTVRIITSPHPMGGMFFIFENVTDAIELERRYNTQIAVQDETLNSLHEGVAVFGRDMRLKLVNQEFKSIWSIEDQKFREGITLTDALDIARRNIIVNDTWDDFKTRVLSLVSGRTARSLSMRLTDSRVLDCTYLPLLDGDHLFSIIDVTDRLLAESALKDKSDALRDMVEIKSQFLQNVSQLLSRPLQKIMGYGEILDSHYQGTLNAGQKRYVRMINSTSHNLSMIVDDLLDISTLELHPSILNLTEVDVEDFLKSVVNPLKDLMKTTRVTLKVAIEKPQGVLSIDVVRMRRAFIRILTHVLHILKTNDIVRLTAKPKGSDSLALRIVFPKREDFLVVLEEKRNVSTDQLVPLLTRLVEMNNGELQGSIKGDNYCLDIVFPLVQKGGGRLTLNAQKAAS